MRNDNFVVIGNSNSLPRTKDNASNFDTCYFKLQEEFVNTFLLYNKTNRSNSTLKQSTNLALREDDTSLDPKVSLKHIGLAEYSPFLLSYLERNKLLFAAIKK